MVKKTCFLAIPCKKCAVCAIMFIFLITACEDNKSKEVVGPSSDEESTATYDNLYVCSKQRENVRVYIKDEETYYTCKNGRWISEKDSNNSSSNDGSSSSEDNEKKELLGSCSEDNEGKVKKNADTSYVCDNGTWRKTTASEKELGVCTTSNIGEKKKIAGYVKCSKGGKWLASADSLIEGKMTDSRDGQTYKTIAIGAQIWMAENLNYHYKVDGETYTNQCYNDSTKYCVKYGRLYSWGAAMDSAKTRCGDDLTCPISENVQGICPDGWHLPSKEEWGTLLDVIGGEHITPSDTYENSFWYFAGAMLKSTTGWAVDYFDQSGNGTDSFGFSAYPAGVGGPDQTPGFKMDRDIEGFEAYSHLGNYARFWSSSNNGYTAFVLNLDNDYDSADLFLIEKRFGVSIRCVKN